MEDIWELRSDCTYIVFQNLIRCSSQNVEKKLQILDYFFLFCPGSLSITQFLLSWAPAVHAFSSNKLCVFDLFHLLSHFCLTNWHSLSATLLRNSKESVTFYSISINCFAWRSNELINLKDEWSAVNLAYTVSIWRKNKSLPTENKCI